MWIQDIVEFLKSPEGEKLSTDDGTIVVSDAKTPSGRVHVGSLRGVILHDVIAKAVVDSNIKSKFIYELDEYDPMDGLPPDADHLRKYMGMPLCKVPSPDPNFSDMADYYASEFLTIFKEIGVEYELLRARNFYTDGTMNEAIERILNHAHVAREVYLEVSNAKRPDHWHPFQVICENCGKIGTTEVSDFDGKEVTYHCRSDLVKWAQGCEYKGKISPFNGNGKLPWKLEWGAKWKTFHVTVEGGGKDHSTKGGSRDVAEECYRRIFNARPPLNVPYEFFLVGGAKMSSSKGLGHSARDIANLLPPEMLRFLMINTPPKRAIDFDPKLEYMVKSFNEYDALVEKNLNGKISEDSLSVLRYSSVDGNLPSSPTQSFQLLYALSQLPHINVEEAVRNRAKETGSPISDDELSYLKNRLKTVNIWIEHFTTEEDRIIIQTTICDKAQNLSNSQKVFLKNLAQSLQENENKSLDADQYQSLIFESARLTPIPAGKAFEAFYALLINRASGPKGGSLLYFLDKQPIIYLISQLYFDEAEYYDEVSIIQSTFDTWIDKIVAKEGKEQEISSETKYNHLVKTMKIGDKLYRQIIKIS